MSTGYTSLYFEYEEYPFINPRQAESKPSRLGVAIVGAGPVGLVTALALVRQGVAVTVLEDEATLNMGSRAAGASRRTLEIIDRLGAGASVLEKGVSWSRGQSYYGDKLVLDFSMPVSTTVKHPPMVNLQQCYFEKFILDELIKSPLVTILWSSAVKEVINEGDHVRLRAATPEGDIELEADWLVACDGARSTVRSSLGLNLEGRSYEGRYIIADVRLSTDLPPGRRVWFDSPGNPGSTIILHRQPDNIWRIDYQLRDDEDSSKELEIDRITARIQTFLDSVGITGPWEMDWTTLYRAHSLSLRDYWHGRVLFAGDAAHLVPIFGARGMNGGIDDIYNLAWKLAYVVKGIAPERLLATYSQERHFAFRENIRNADKSTKVMAPPTRGDLLMRDAVLQLAVDHSFVRPLLNPRQSQDIILRNTPLNDIDEQTSQGALALGQVCPNLAISIRSTTKDTDIAYLQDILGPQFTLLIASDYELPPVIIPETVQGIALKSVRITQNAKQAAEHDIIDPDHTLLDMLGLESGGAVLVRPDHHIMARWATLKIGKITSALQRITMQH